MIFPAQSRRASFLATFPQLSSFSYSVAMAAFLNPKFDFLPSFRFKATRYTCSPATSNLQTSSAISFLEYMASSRLDKILAASGCIFPEASQSILQWIRLSVEPSIEELTMISTAGNPAVYF